MRVSLAAPYADVRADDLALEIDAPDAPALEALELALGGFRVELRLLGQSHQVVVGAPGFALTETVSCRARPQADGRLPAAHVLRRDDRTYAFSAAVVPLATIGDGALVAAVAADPRGLVGDFPGTAGAFTALRAAAVTRGVRWETWHAYPQTGELVRTTGEVVTA